MMELFCNVLARQNVALKFEICWSVVRDGGRVMPVEKCFNIKISKTPLPALEQVILGCLYDSGRRHVRTAEDKRTKYLHRIELLLGRAVTRTSDILQIHGNLNYASQVSPFGRPFLAPLTDAVCGLTQDGKVAVSERIKMGLRIWKMILKVNENIFRFRPGKST